MNLNIGEMTGLSKDVISSKKEKKRKINGTLASVFNARNKAMGD